MGKERLSIVFPWSFYETYHATAQAICQGRYKFTSQYRNKFSAQLELGTKSKYTFSRKTEEVYSVHFTNVGIAP